jgi:hypothetical protein
MRGKRPVHTPVPDGEYTIWTPSIVAQHQREDEVLGTVMEWLETGGARPEWVEVSPKSATLKYWWSRYDGHCISSQGVLLLAWADRRGNQAWKTIVPFSLQLVLLQKWHDSKQGGHLWANKTWSRVKISGYVWHSMRTSVASM